MKKRKSGIIIHPTSFTSSYGCGDLGYGSRQVIDWLKKAGQSILQILPLGPTGYGDSPYQSFSAFAGTPYIISFDILINKGFLKNEDLSDYPTVDFSRVNYGLLYSKNFEILYKAYQNFSKTAAKEIFDSFCSENSNWLDDYALFMSIKDSYEGKSWNLWDADLKHRKNLDKLDKKITERAKFYKFIQWEFDSQWNEFKKYAVNNNIQIIGDAPIFVSFDSADVWANQDLFYLDDECNPEIVAGVPPDYFSKTGQLWGNPIYKWDIMKKNNYTWWKKRINHLLKFVDCIRIDHFRGFEAYWEIPFGEETAVNGKWITAPGFDFFEKLKKEFGEKLPELIIAEDLGVITDEVKKLRDEYKLPGMKIFEFANFPKISNEKKENEHIDNFTENSYLPDNFTENCIAYPGTHDNDTLLGWFDSLSEEKQNDILKYLKIENKEKLNFAVINKLSESKADRVVFLLQDVLELPTEHRMNHPGTCGIHNWSWRISKNMLTDKLAEKLYDIAQSTGRI